MVRFICYLAVSIMLASAWVAIGRGLGVREFDVGYVAGIITTICGSAFASGGKA